MRACHRACQDDGAAAACLSRGRGGRCPGQISVGVFLPLFGSAFPGGGGADTSVGYEDVEAAEFGDPGGEHLLECVEVAVAELAGDVTPADCLNLLDGHGSIAGVSRG